MTAYFFEALFSFQNLKTLIVPAFLVCIIFLALFIKKRNATDGISLDSIHSEEDAQKYVERVRTKAPSYWNVVLYVLMLGLFLTPIAIGGEFDLIFVGGAALFFSLIVWTVSMNIVPGLVEDISVSAKVFKYCTVFIMLGSVVVMLIGIYLENSNGLAARGEFGAVLAGLLFGVPGLTGSWYVYKAARNHKI